ncbi:winged helix-turn-helix transcriptional regulator [Nocardioides sp. Kera G14]|uniref:winged helix-turn-helix transcriptional regulator n=1 Tax=Nocardioides sp. Kera G14 TaxID=2884264 RepID=UPI001D115E07|nr:helix-turn-helix domain-containing protein [Nocardioides sp. Kera G14]UDY23720.1 helix-turn-helix transcriptional regulator [Nocardioides sp. Kera G14]
MEHSAPQCDASLSAAFGILGKRWNGVIIGVLAEGDAGFADLSRGLGSQISDSVLSSRLTELSELGLISREVTAGPPVSVHYSLTESGRALIPALDALAGWAKLHLEPAGAPVPASD